MDMLEFEQGRLAYQFQCGFGIRYAGQVDNNTVDALSLNNGLRDSVLVDPVAQNSEKPLNAVIGQGIFRGPLSLEQDMGPSLEVQSKANPPPRSGRRRAGRPAPLPLRL